MFYIISRYNFQNSGDKFYLYDYNEKKKIASYSQDRNKAITFTSLEDATDLNNAIPDTIRGLVIAG